jgi:hypothetical protein
LARDNQTSDFDHYLDDRTVHLIKKTEQYKGSA